jgi:PAS domain S-box-containing protein
MENYPGWNLIFLSDINSILKRVSIPLIKISGYLILTLCVFIGLTVFILYKKANREIDQRKKAEEALRIAHNDLEKRVEERTLDLTKSVDELQNEIVERKRVEEALRGSEEKYRTLTDNLSVGVFRSTPGPKGNYIEVNSSYTRIFGFENKETLLSLYAYDIYQNPDDRDKFSKKMLKDGAVNNEEIMFKRRDGTPFLGSVTAVAVKDDDGKVRCYDGILEDITELRQAKQEAQKRREEMAHLGRVATMGELSASLAHEINQPLTAILSNAQAALRFISSDSPDLAEIRDILGDIVADDRRAGEVIYRLRSLFRKGKIERVKVDINDLVQEVVSLINTEAMIRNISLETALDEGLPPVLGDRIHLQQVIINFILNASEAMKDIDDAPREIIISTSRTDKQMVKVGIRDFGIGIIEDNLNQIIEPFYTTKPEGMGMGLSINRSIIDAHDGRFWADNNPDRGATFYFTLPIHEEA